MTEETTGSIREALDNAGFDWDNGTVYKPASDGGKGLEKLFSSDIYLNGKASYYALDGTFVYMSAFMSFFTYEGIFPGKARADSVETIEVNAEKYFENDTLKDTLIKVVNGLEILSMTDVQPPEGIDVVFRIVGSKDVPFFVCVGTSEEDAIRLFMDRILRAARLSVLNNVIEGQLLQAMVLGGSGN